MKKLVTLPVEGGTEAREASAGDILGALVARWNERARLNELGIPHRYVGRHTSHGNVTNHGKYGNPFSHLDNTQAQFKVGNRQEAVDAYANWIRQPEQAKLLAEAKEELAGKVLLCHCQDWHERSPSCHAEVLVRLANPALAAEEARELGQVGGAPCKLDFSQPWEFFAWLTAFGLEGIPKMLFTGDRNWKSVSVVKKVLLGLKEHHGRFVVIQGEASGADEMVRDQALILGLPVAGFPADWSVKADTPEWAIRTGKNGAYDVRAGGQRNAVMSECAPTACWAFHDNIAFAKGTKDMCSTAWLKSIPVVVWSSDQTYEEFGAGAPGHELPWQFKKQAPGSRPKVAAPSPTAAAAAIIEPGIRTDTPSVVDEDLVARATAIVEQLHAAGVTTVEQLHALQGAVT